MSARKQKAKIISYNAHVRLPQEMFEQLTASAEEKGSTLSAEMRERLRLSLYHKRAKRTKLKKLDNPELEVKMLREALREIKSCEDINWAYDVIRQVEDGTYNPWY